MIQEDQRSTRFSMLVDDATPVGLNIGDNPTEVSVRGAEHMLGQL